MSRLHTSLACCLVALSSPAVAVAQESPPSDAPASERSKPSAAGREGDRHLEAGRPAEAAKAFERAFVDTKDASYLRKAAEAYAAIGPEGRSDARMAFALYRQSAATDEQRAEADRRIAELDALDRPPEPETPPEPEPPPPPPPAEPPPATAVERVAGLKWSPTLGFVQDDAPPSPVRDEASSGALEVPGLSELGFSGAGFRIGVGVLTLNPINDGETDDETALNIAQFSMDLRLEFQRTPNSWIAPWLEISSAWADGKKEETAPTSTDRTMTVMAVQVNGRFGIDLQPLSFFGAGPFVGYRLDGYQADFETENDSTDNSMETDSGLVYGLHARIRTKETATSPPLLTLEPTLTWRTGEHITGTYGGFELALRAGSVVFAGMFERRLSASGSFEAADVPDLSRGFAKSMPIEQRVGISFGGLWDGRG